MAENTRPFSSLPPAMTTKERRSSRQPMANLEDSTNRTQLVSPPPEETLNHLRRVFRNGPFTPDISTSKRKRNTMQGNSQATETPQVETTPNPKPRKQFKNALTILESPTKLSRTTPGRPYSLNPKSPHADNPEADWLPPIPSSASRRATISARARKTTPIPAYEPPADVFTPPREVMILPAMSKSSKRKNPANKRQTSVTPSLTITIKKEPPQIDLSAPMPPPSPTDDPLLLSGPPEASTPVRPRRNKNVPSIAGSPPQSPLPPSSEPDDDDEMEHVTERFDWTKHTVPEGSTDDMSMMELDEQDRAVPPIPLFDLDYEGPANQSAGWDSSDDEDVPAANSMFEEGQGEYTGRWRQTMVPTKADPPSSATRDRMEEWGRPITPFPREKIKRLSLVKEAVDQEPVVELESVVQGQVAQQSPEQPALEQEDEHDEAEEEREVRELSIPPCVDNEEPEQARLAQPAAPVVDARFNFDKSFEEDAGESPNHVLHHSSPPAIPAVDARFNFDQSFEDSFEAELPDMVHNELSLPEDGDGVEDVSLSTTFAVEDQNEPYKLLDRQAHDENIHDAEEEEEEEEEREVREMSVDFTGEEEEAVDDDQPAETEGRPILDGLDRGARATSPVRRETLFQSLGPRVLPLPARASTVEEIPQNVPHVEPVDGHVPLEKHFGGQENTQRAPFPTSFPADPVREGANSSASEHTQDRTVCAPDAEDSSDSEDESYDLGIVKITSADPRAAARAAAILKQHDYDCFTKIMMKQRRRTLSKSTAPSRRNSVIGGGIVKQSTISEVEKLKKRRVTMGVIGETAYIPGSPVKTLPQLLQEAEAEVTMMHSPRISQAPIMDERNPFETPFARRRSSLPFSGTTPVIIQERFGDDGRREWTKEEWKLLDACFTDERMELGREDLAPVDDVRLEDVVARFIRLVGGDELVRGYGDGWDRENLMQRATALQAKQRSGKVAPPTTPFATPASRGTDRTRLSTLEPSILTPLSRHGLKPPRPRLDTSRPQPLTPLGDAAPFASLPGQTEPAEEVPRAKLPVSLLAPRYSHLLQEAIEISQSGASAGIPEDLEEAASRAASPISPMETSHANLAQAPSTIGKRVKSFVTSYLPMLQNSARSSKETFRVPPHPSLPPPPKDFGGKRGPVITPARPAQSRPKHPKDIVHLQPAPPTQKTQIPKRTAPKRLVDLQPVPAQEATKVLIEAPRPRRSSGASVKDLVKTFEQKDTEAREQGSGTDLKRVKSIERWSNRLNGSNTRPSRPTWRP